MLLQGKVALVTGAARGIGRATALVLAAEGADVGVADLSPAVDETARAVQALGRRSAAVVCDVADVDQVREAVARTREALGAIDVLVNNAGIVNNVAALTKMSHAAWQREIDVNLTGAFNVIKEVIGPMIERKWGRIINISSSAATQGIHRQIAYAASKAGLLGLTKTVTLEHARDGITCNAILPGLIETENVRAMPEEIKQRAIALTPARRLGKVEEVGQIVAFLASDRAAFLNGLEVYVDGGMRLNPAPLGSRKEALELGRIGS